MFDGTPIQMSAQRWQSRGSRPVRRHVVRTAAGEIVAMHEGQSDDRPWLRAGYRVAIERVRPEDAACFDEQARIEAAMERAAR